MKKCIKCIRGHWAVHSFKFYPVFYFVLLEYLIFIDIAYLYAITHYFGIYNVIVFETHYATWNRKLLKQTFITSSKGLKPKMICTLSDTASKNISFIPFCDCPFPFCALPALFEFAKCKYILREGIFSKCSTPKRQSSKLYIIYFMTEPFTINSIENNEKWHNESHGWI